MKHPQAELMAQYAQDAMETDKPWDRWEFNAGTGVWVANGYHPSWDEKYEYRRKQKPYKPTLLDQALELEIEAARLKANYYGDKIGDEFSIFRKNYEELRLQRSPEMIEHLKQKGKL